MGYNNGSWSVGDWLAMGAIMLLFLGLATGLVVWAVRSFGSGGRGAGSERGSAAGPDEVLAERYARGEIDEDEFRRRGELLHRTPGSRPQPGRTL